VLTEQFLIESRQREQVALAEAELQSKRLESILMQAPALICIFEGPSHVYKLVNPPYQKAVGGRPLVGKPIREAMPELEGQAIFGLLDQVYQTGETFQAREMLVQFDHLNEGKLGENYYNFTYQAIRNVAGEIDGILVFAYEVTDQVHARKLAEALNQELGEANKEITASNEELRLAYEEIMSTNESLAYSQDIARELNEELEKRVTERTEELSESNRQLENTLKNLHEKNFELDQFVYKTSHDLRAPLTTIMGLITLYKLEKEESARAHYISLVETRVHKLDKFIQAMLDYSRNTRTVTSYSYINFKTFVRECIDELEHMKHYSRMHFSLHIPDGEFYSDAFRLKIIFSNLISNAIKYQDFNKPESTLSIRVDFHPDQAVIHMEDNGTGIDQQYQSKLFDMFFRASEQSEGSGLGLYIVKQAVGMLNGKIGLQSKLGEGTRFIINLPRIPNQGAS
jgi:signal transduction histidine kinase